MPELPEVQTVVTTLRQCLAGQTLARISHLRADMIEPFGVDFGQAVCGRAITDVSRRGKRIVVQLDDGNRFFIHLGMTGQLTVVPRDEPVAPHTHLVVDLSAGLQLRFRDVRRFGRIVWLGESDDDTLGPEPLTLRPSRLVESLSKTRRAIKTALLDQKLLAGVGNIYADEALFRAGIHPRRQCNRLTIDRVERLTKSLKDVLRSAIRHRGSTLRDFVDANGQAGGYAQRHQVYARSGERCVACGTTIRRIVLGQRSTHFCPKCQT